jgi:hypothetical protein
MRSTLALTQRDLDRIGLPILFDLMGRLHDEHGDRIDCSRVFLAIDKERHEVGRNWVSLGSWSPRTIYFAPELPLDAIETRFPDFGPLPDLESAVRVLLLHELAHWRLGHNGLMAGLERADTRPWERNADAIALEWYRNGFPAAIGEHGKPLEKPSGYLKYPAGAFIEGRYYGPFRLLASAARRPSDVYAVPYHEVEDSPRLTPEELLRHVDEETKEEVLACIRLEELRGTKAADRFAKERLRLVKRAISREKDPERLRAMAGVLEQWSEALLDARDSRFDQR